MGITWHKGARGEKMKNRTTAVILIIALIFFLGIGGVYGLRQVQTQNIPVSTSGDILYACTDHSFTRNGILVHLDCMTKEGERPEKQILLTHGVTYSSHEFDADYEDYSLVRFLARNGYAVWRIDIAGYGQSGSVSDGFLPDTEYAAEDIAAAVNEIVRLSGKDQIDMLGWSWGTVTAGRYAAEHPVYLRRLVLYAPILTGIGEYEVTEEFHHNTWSHAMEDFQMDENGQLDETVTDPVLAEIYCSNCWRYDGDRSPNGGRRDICVDKTETLIDFSALRTVTLLLYGDRDPYLNLERIEADKSLLPEGSKAEKFSGGSHVMMYEKPRYHEFQETLISFLSS